MSEANRTVCAGAVRLCASCILDLLVIKCFAGDATSMVVVRSKSPAVFEIPPDPGFASEVRLPRCLHCGVKLRFISDSCD
jgi:hypothetical protein